MIFLRRYIPIFIVAFFGSLTLFGWFIDNDSIEAFVNDDATQWYDIIASFAIFLGALNLLKLQFLKVLKRQSGWQYSVIAIVSFFAVFVIGFFMKGAFSVTVPNAIIVEYSEKNSKITATQLHFTQESAEQGVKGLKEDRVADFDEDKGVWKIFVKSPEDVQTTFFTNKSAEKFVNDYKESNAGGDGDLEIIPAQWGAHIQTEGGLFKWMFDNVFTPLSATMFALLAFYVASASYRAFRARNFEATLLLLAGIIIMIGRVPAGGLISSWMVMYMLVLVLGIVVNTYVKHRQIVFGVVALGLLGVTLLGWSMGWPVDQPSVFYLPALQEWIYSVPNLAGARAIMIGIGLGIIITSLRYIFGLEKSYIGDQ